MKYCGQCCAQLNDNDVFCGECGAKQETLVIGTQASCDNPGVVISPAPEIVAPKTSNSAKQAQSNDIPGWIVLTVLILCYPLVCAFWLVELIYMLPESLLMIAFFGCQIAALAMMFSKKKWAIWIKVIILALYILAYII